MEIDKELADAAKVFFENYSPDAEAEIWREAWESYPNHRFFARCFVKEAKNAYLQPVRES
jgi:hypothetical protein